MQGCLRVTDTVYTSDLIANGAINNLLITSGNTNTTIAPLTGKSLTIQAESALYLRSIANTSIVFYEGTSQVGRFNNSGNFVIGSANANAETEKLYVYGKVKIDDSTASTAAATGALVISGGLSTGADSFLTGSVHIIGQAANDPLITRGIAGGASTGVRGTSSDEKALYLNYTGGIVNVGKTDNSTDKLYVQYATASTSTTTGALIVQGGVGIGGALNVSGDIRGGDLTISGNIIIRGKTANASSGVSSAYNEALTAPKIIFKDGDEGSEQSGYLIADKFDSPSDNIFSFSMALVTDQNKGSAFISNGIKATSKLVVGTTFDSTYAFKVSGNSQIDGELSLTTPLSVANGGTGSTIGKGAANNLMVPFLGAGVGFTNGDNIDTYTTPGTFFSTGQDQSTTLQGNVPITTTGFKLLIARTYSTNRIIQFAQKNSAEIFLRYNNTAEDSTTWGEWRKLVSIKSGTDKKTFAKIGDTDAPVYINSDGVAYACTTPFAKGNARVYYGTCTTAAGTAIKDVTCSTYDGLTIGDMITVKFTITNSATAANLKLRVNSTEEADAIPIKCQVAATISNLPAVGYLQENRPYTFVYDGANWVMMNVNRDNNDLTVRTYVLSSTTELPILAVSTNTTGGWTNYTGNKQLNGVISATTANRPTINPYTGHITAPAGITTNFISYTDGTTKKTMISFSTGGTSGHKVKITGHGLTVIGAGESADNVNTSATTEDLYLLADRNVFIESNADTFENRVGICINSGGNNEILPINADIRIDNTLNLGAANARWKDIYAVNFNGKLINRTNLVKGTLSGSNSWQVCWANYQTGTGTTVADRIGGYVESAINGTNGSTTLGLYAYQYQSGSTNCNYIHINCDTNGNFSYAVADAPKFREAISAPSTTGGNACGNWSINAAGIVTPNIAGYTTDEYGNFQHATTTTTNNWNLKNYEGTKKFAVYWESGDTETGTLRVYPSTGGNYQEGIRVSPYNSWSILALLGNSGATNSEGITADDWGVYNNDGRFLIARSYTSSGTRLECNKENMWTLATSSTSTSNYTTAGLQIREYNRCNDRTAATETWAYAPRLSFHWSGRNAAQIAVWSNGRLYEGIGTTTTFKKIWVDGDSITGAVWNDYAECRISECKEFGYVVMETGKDTLIKTNKRLSHFAGITSDTWGFLQGETELAKTPIAVAGRVLAYPYQDRNNYKPGDCVCAAPNGTVDIMTREEIIQYPDRIVGTVSCVPNYEEWGGGDREPIKINGRIWIKVH